MQTKAMSTGLSLASCCASVTCSARTGTENSATSLAWVTRSPCFFMCSMCSGQGSMNVTSSPAWRHRRSAALFDGLQPDLGPAQQRAARRQGEIRQFRSRGCSQGGARRGYPAGRYDPGLWREILPARYAALRPERALDAGGDAKCRRTYLGGLAEQYPDAGPGFPAPEIVDLRRLDGARISQCDATALFGGPIV